MKFKKISALTPADRAKVKNYWSDLWGTEFATALTTDFENDGKSAEVKANNKSNKDLRLGHVNKIEKVTL